MIGSSSLYLPTKAARILRDLPGRSLRSLPKPFAVESYGSLRNLRALPIAAGMEDEAARNPAPPASVSADDAGGTRPRVSTAAAGGLGGGECFEVSPSSVLKLQKGDITKWFVDGSTDAIVSSRLPSLFVS